MDFNNLNFEEQIEVDVTTDVMVRIPLPRECLFSLASCAFHSFALVCMGYM